jgi:anaerobic selenocysteine-containing dehydrogenase
MPPMLAAPPVPPPSSPRPPGAAGALRLVARRTLWDAGTQVQAVPELSGLHPAARVTVHPSVLAGMGTAEGEPVRVASPRGAMILPSHGDGRVPPGTVLVGWNLPGGSAGDLIDAESLFTEVTVAPADLGADDGPEGGGSNG